MADAETPWLTPVELQDLTGRQTWPAQARTLARMQIPFMLNGIGRPLVERTAVLRGEQAQPKGKRSKFNWAAMEKPGKAA